MQTEKRLREKWEERQSILLARKHLDRLQERLRMGYSALEELLTHIKLEENDVEYYEKISTNFLFRKILGEQDEQLEIERQEHLQAILDYRDAKRTLELLEFEKKVLEEKVARLPKLDNEIDRLIQQREQEMLAQDSEGLRIIHKLNRELGTAIRLRREIYEAKVLGLQSAQLVQSMAQLLREAMEHQAWGKPARLFFRSRKPDYVHLTLEKFYQLKNRLRAFSDELRDIYLQHNIRQFRGIEQFQNLSSGYYDNLINDWIVRHRISNSLNMIGSLHDGLVRALASLKQEESRVEEKIRYLEMRKKSIILEEVANS